MTNTKLYPWNDPSISRKYIPPKKGDPGALGHGKIVSLKLSEYEYECIDYFSATFNRSRHGQLKQIIQEWIEERVKQVSSPYTLNE